MAFLMKWAWKLLVEDNSLWVQIVNAKYMRNKDFFDIEAQPSDSTMWKAILKARQYIHKGICIRIGNGEDTSIWFHPWVPGGDLQPEPLKDATEGISMVRNFIRDNGWNEDLSKNDVVESAIRLPPHKKQNSQSLWYLGSLLPPLLNGNRRLLSPVLGVSSGQSCLVWKGSYNHGKNMVFEEFCCAQEYLYTNQHRGTQHQCRLAELDGKQNAQHSLQTEWLPPPINWRMCNTDAAIGNRVSARAAVFRDEQGTITNAFTTKLFYRDSLAGEIASLCSGAEAAVQLGLKMVIFQSDSVGAIEAVKSNSQSIASLNHNVQQLVTKFQGLTSKLVLWEINWIPRKLNGVAHEVAQWAIRTYIFGRVGLPNFDSFLSDERTDGCL
uniref:RNase H type-1 domain-containing protein n=1 Tax=Cannabis sativa TaxID=3483 RepID=A0A803QDC9_CANSA